MPRQRRHGINRRTFFQSVGARAAGVAGADRSLVRPCEWAGDVMKRLLITLALLLSVSCAARHHGELFRVIQANPEYLLRSPDSKNTPFPEVLSQYTSLGQGWVDVRRPMKLRIENAYYREGAPKRGLTGFLGTEIAWYAVRPKTGLRLISIQSGLVQRPGDQPPVQQLIPPSQMRHRRYRFFFEVLFNRKDELRGAVLLGTGSSDELDRLAAKLLTEPESICGGRSTNCTIFPELCTVSVEIEIVVNGTPRTVFWGSLLASVARRPRHLELLRPYAGRLTPVEIDFSDPKALRLPLLPGDRIYWY